MTQSQDTTAFLENMEANKGFFVDIYYGDDYTTIIDRLKANRWIDDNTRVVLLRWTVYNFWSERYMYTEAQIELPTGFNIETEYYISSVSLSKSQDNLMWFLISALLLN